MDKLAGPLLKILMGSSESRMDADLGIKEIVSQFKEDLKGVLTRDDIRALIKQDASPRSNAVIEQAVAGQLAKDVGRFMKIGGFGRHILCQLSTQPAFIERVSAYLRQPGKATVEGFIRFLRPAVSGGAAEAADIAPDMYYVVRALLKDKDLVQKILETILEENIREMLSEKGMPEVVQQATAKFIAAYADKLRPWTASETHAVIAALDDATKQTLQELFTKLEGRSPTTQDIQAGFVEICSAGASPRGGGRRSRRRRRRGSGSRRRGRKSKSVKYT